MQFDIVFRFYVLGGELLAGPLENGRRLYYQPVETDETVQLRAAFCARIADGTVVVDKLDGGVVAEIPMSDYYDIVCDSAKRRCPTVVALGIEPDGSAVVLPFDHAEQDFGGISIVETMDAAVIYDACVLLRQAIQHVASVLAFVKIIDPVDALARTVAAARAVGTYDLNKNETIVHHMAVVMCKIEEAVGLESSLAVNKQYLAQHIVEPVVVDHPTGDAESNVEAQSSTKPGPTSPIGVPLDEYKVGDQYIRYDEPTIEFMTAVFDRLNVRTDLPAVEDIEPVYTALVGAARAIKEHVERGRNVWLLGRDGDTLFAAFRKVFGERVRYAPGFNRSYMRAASGRYEITADELCPVAKKLGIEVGDLMVDTGFDGSCLLPFVDLVGTLGMLVTASRSVPSHIERGVVAGGSEDPVRSAIISIEHLSICNGTKMRFNVSLTYIDADGDKIPYEVISADSVTSAGASSWIHVYNIALNAAMTVVEG